MAFNLYLAGSYARECDDKMMEIGTNRLGSQLNDRKLLKMWAEYCKDNNVHRKIFVDSGAFSAFTRRQVVDLDDYVNFVNSYKGMFEVIVQLDKIPSEPGKKRTLEQIEESAELSWENFLYMVTVVHDWRKVVPVFHNGEKFTHLQRMLEHRFEDGTPIDYIGISPGHFLSVKDKQHWIEQCFRVIKASSNPNVKVHAFGMTSLNVLEQYPFHSADSTSWLMTSATGQIMTPWGNVSMSDKRTDMPDHFDHMPKEIKDQIEEFVNKYGHTTEECRTDYKARGMINLQYLTDWAKNYVYKGTNRYQKRLF